MRDHRLKVNHGKDETRAGKFDYLRIIEQTGRIALEFPDSNTEFSEFRRGDVLEFDTPQSSFTVRSLDGEGSTPVEFYAQTMAGVRARSALLVGDVTITGVEQDNNDEPLVVRTGRGLDVSNTLRQVVGNVGAVPPGTVLFQLSGVVTMPNADNYAYFHITNSSMIPAGAGQQFIDRRVALVSGFPDMHVIRWIEEGETVVVPKIDGQMWFACLTQSADFSNSASGIIDIVGELK